MEKIKFTKGELKKQRDSLKQFRHYLPTLQLKKQQLQMRILECRRNIEDKMALIGQKEGAVVAWAGLLRDLKGGIHQWINPQKIRVNYTNIAGANIPVFDDVEFLVPEYDYYEVPFWVDKAIEEFRVLAKYYAEVGVIKKQIEILEKELRITTQRVNLFEKVKIPECLDNIRRIRISLGDQQANAVGISKVAKKKVEFKDLEEAIFEVAVK